MKTLRKKVFTMIGLVAVLTLFTNPIIVSASVTTQKFTLTDQEINTLKEMLTELEVDETTQNHLIEKLQNGQLWDSMKEEQLALIPNEYLNVTPENPVKKYVFPDGSVIQNELDIISIEKVKSSSKDISDGQHSSGSGYHTVAKARTHQSGGSVSLEFYANYTLVDGGYDKITRIYDPSVKVSFGSSDTPSLTMVKQTENLNAPAQAKLTVQVTFDVIVTESETRWLKLYVGNDKAWTEFR